MESEAALVRSDGLVILDTEAAINANLVTVIHPWHSELDYALWLADSFEDLKGKILVTKKNKK